MKKKPVLEERIEKLEPVVESSSLKPAESIKPTPSVKKAETLHSSDLRARYKHFQNTLPQKRRTR